MNLSDWLSHREGLKGDPRQSTTASSCLAARSSASFDILVAALIGASLCSRYNSARRSYFSSTSA